LVSSRAARHARIDQHRCVILATNELDATQLPPPQLVDADTGQTHGERGFRGLKDPEFLASARDLNTPERIMALLRVMTVCWLVYAALEYRMRQALQGQDATFPTPQGQRVQQPTARWVWPDFVGMH